MYHNSTDSDLYTISYAEAVDAYTNLNYNPETSPGYVAPVLSTCRCDLKPVYRVDRSGDKEDHLFTNNQQEAKDAVANSGYSDNGISFYCADKSGDCGASLALYRYKRGNAIHNHVYTTNVGEGKTIVAAGGTDEGILCYIWAN